jgi:hypothetical protein
MQSSTSSPFKLRVLDTHVGSRKTFHPELFAGFQMRDVTVTRSVTEACDVVRVTAEVGTSVGSLLNAPDARRVLVLGHIRAEVLTSIEAMPAPNPPTLRDAIMFAIKELDPMLHTLTTLRAIELGIDIHVEHGLRYTDRALKAMTKNLSGRPFGFLLRDR